MVALYPTTTSRRNQRCIWCCAPAVVCRSLTGKTITLDVEASDTIGNDKDKIKTRRVFSPISSVSFSQASTVVGRRGVTHQDLDRRTPPKFGGFPAPEYFEKLKRLVPQHYYYYYYCRWLLNCQADQYQQGDDKDMSCT